MKHTLKLLTVFIMVLLLAGTAAKVAAKETKKDKGKKAAFNKGSATIGISLGVGVDYDYYGDVTTLPAVTLTYDRGIIGNVGPGTIGIGGIIAFKTAYYDYENGDRATWNNYIVGARATYHLTILKDKNNKFDPYAGVMVGFRYDSYNDNYYGGSSLANPYSYSPIYPIAGFFVGAKYNFMKHLGVFAELGYDISLFRIGLNFNN